MTTEKRFPINKLWFKFIKGSTLETKYSVETLAETLEALGFIEVSADRERYAETEKFKPYRTRFKLHRFITEKLLVIFLMFIVGCNSTGQSGPELKILVAGQSNATSLDRGDPYVYSITGLVRANDFRHDNAVRIPTPNDPMDSNLSWIRLGDLMSRPVMFMNIAQGGTTIDQWNTQFFNLIDEQVSMTKFDAVLWVQGETDFYNGTTESDYYNGLKALIEHSRVTDPSLKWFIAITSDGPDGNAIREAQLRLINDGIAFQGPDIDQAIRTNPAWTMDGTNGLQHIAHDGHTQHAKLWFESLRGI